MPILTDVSNHCSLHLNGFTTFATMSLSIILRNKIYLVIFLLVTSFFIVGCKSKKVASDFSKSKKGHIVSSNLKQRYAALLNISEKDIRNEQLYEFINDWMGVPHMDGGITKKGIDCSGFTLLLQKNVYNKTLPRMAKQMAESVRKKDEKQLQEGDLVFFDFKGKKYSHVGVYLQNNKFVHVSSSRGVVVSNLKDPWYYKYFSKAGSVN